MTHRSATAISALALGALVLSGCGLLPPAPTPTAKPTVEVTPTATPTPEPDPLPADALLSLSMRATNDSGAAVDILLVLLKPEPVGSDGAAPRAAAIVDWCVDEVDQSVTESQNYSFGELDATVTAVAGTPVWPADLALHLAPGEQGGAGLATGGAAYQVQRPNELDDPGFYVPHCQQDAFLGVPGTGALYLGWDNDGSNLDRWLTMTYGATFDEWGEPVGDPPVLLSDCTLVITDLGLSMGASASSFSEFFSDTQCFAVGNTP